MKIVQVVSQMEAAGAQKVASLLTDGLRERGHHAQLWFLYKKRAAFEENAYVKCITSNRPYAAGWLGTAARLWHQLRADQTDVVIAHTHSANIFAAPIAAMAGVPVRFAVHHNPIETYTPFTRYADKTAFRLGIYSMMVAVSGGVRQSFSKHSERYQDRLHRIYNGVSFTEHIDPSDIRARYRIPEGHAVLVNVGRLARQKNQEMLLEMLARIPDSTLLLVGEGERGVDLRMIAASLGVTERVRFTGEVSSPQVAGILEQSDLFLLPSLYESFCMAAVEAMLHALPVVASDLPCLREVLGKEQLFFPLNDLDALVRIVNRLLETPRERQEMSKAAYIRAQDFTVERMVGEYELLMAEAMLYAPSRKSAANDFRRLNALGRVPGVHDHL